MSKKRNLLFLLSGAAALGLVAFVCNGELEWPPMIAAKLSSLIEWPPMIGAALFL